MKKLAIVTSTRADWGLLRPLVDCLNESGKVQTDIVATNMHLMAQFGHTVDEITSDGYDVAAEVAMDTPGDDPASRVRAAAMCMAGMADAFERLSPDAVLILGDRYEMLATASAAAIMHLPIVHIAGGAISEGAIDDNIRHAITKLSSLHLTETADYRRRVVQMGEQPDTVVNTGAIGVWNMLNMPSVPSDELEHFIGMPLEGDPIAIVTFHPATADTSSTPSEQVEAMLAAMSRFERLRYVITYPNNDAGGASTIPLLQQFADEHPATVRLIPSLGSRRYISMLRHAAMVIGNSSSGIVEVPSAGIPTVDIGKRQRGRTAANSVLHCRATADDIEAAIATALTPAMRAQAAVAENPYFKPDTPRLMTDAIVGWLNSMPINQKKFYDLP